MIIGLDISTAVVGITILTQQGNFVDSSAVALPKADLSERALFLQDRLKEIIGDYEITQIWIEEPFQRFAKGGSTAATMIRLATFNGMCQFMIYQMTGVLPGLINPNAARKTVGIKIQREKTCGISTKEQVLGWAKTRIPHFKWPKKTLKSGPRRGQTINCPSCYDIADSYVVANAGFVKSKTIQ